ncbi:MAG: hypothetical protein CENE_03817 [Candidatus Celerinatantimonas neptuna]|nr:MAG: hypothetical protein CENE_03817 [Candidatus Celerinatantimonas neptuna]
MKSFKKIVSSLVNPDEVMDLFVSKRWDTASNPAEKDLDDDIEQYYFDRSGAFKININNKHVRDSFKNNVELLKSK